MVGELGYFENPFYALSRSMKHISSVELVIVERLWSIFSKYVTAHYAEESKTRAEAEYVKDLIENLERLASRLLQKLSNPVWNEEYVEAGVLTYFMLVHSGLINKGRWKHFVEVLSQRVEECINDIEYMERSLSTAKCIGFGYAVIDKLSKDKIEVLEHTFLQRCREKRIQDQDAPFCTYALFGKALAATSTNRIDEAKKVIAVAKTLIQYEWLKFEGIALTLIAYSIAARILHGEVEEIDMKTMYITAEKLYRKLYEELKHTSIFRLRRKIWIELSLALKLNKLDKVKLVYGDNITIPRKDLANFLERLEEKLLSSKLSRRYPLLFGLASAIQLIISILSIFNIVPQLQLDPRWQLIIFIILILIISTLCYRQSAGISEALEDVRRFKEKIEEGL